MKNKADNLPKIIQNEQVSQETRKWIRISKACNNRCLFCLDSQHQDRSFLPFDTISPKIEDAAQQHYDRLILSGGEASIHPQFIDFIRF